MYKLNDRYRIDVISTLNDSPNTHEFISDHEYVYATHSNEKILLDLPIRLKEEVILSINNLNYDNISKTIWLSVIVKGDKEILMLLFYYSLEHNEWKEVPDLYDTVYKFVVNNNFLIISAQREPYYRTYDILNQSVKDLNIERDTGRFFNSILSFNIENQNILLKFISNDGREKYCLYNWYSQDMNFYDDPFYDRRVSFDDYTLFDNFFIAVNRQHQYTSDIYLKPHHIKKY